MNNLPEQISADSAFIRFPGLLKPGTMHEFRAPEATAGHLALVTLLLAELPLATPILWVSPTATWYPPGLAWLGLDPGRCLFAEARNDAESLGTLEVALRGGMAGVAESLGLSRLAARRLALAAKDGNSIGYLLRHASRQTALDSTSFATRWLVTPAPNGRLQAELLYAKGAQPAVFVYEILQEANHGTTAPALPLVDQRDSAHQRRAG